MFKGEQARNIFKRIKEYSQENWALIHQIDAHSDLGSADNWPANLKSRMLS